jgi:hypothetical protein
MNGYSRRISASRRLCEKSWFFPCLFHLRAIFLILAAWTFFPCRFFITVGAQCNCDRLPCPVQHGFGFIEDFRRRGIIMHAHDFTTGFIGKGFQSPFYVCIPRLFIGLEVQLAINNDRKHRVTLINPMPAEHSSGTNIAERSHLLKLTNSGFFGIYFLGFSLRISNTHGFCCCLPFPIPKPQVHYTRHDSSYRCDSTSPGSAFFGDFLWRWTKSYPLQPAQQASGIILFSRAKRASYHR